MIKRPVNRVRSRDGQPEMREEFFDVSLDATKRAPDTHERDNNAECSRLKGPSRYEAMNTGPRISTFDRAGATWKREYVALFRDVQGTFRTRRDGFPGAFQALFPESLPQHHTHPALSDPSRVE